MHKTQAQAPMQREGLLELTIVALRLGSPLFNGEQQCPRYEVGNYRLLPVLVAYDHLANHFSFTEGPVRRHNSL